MIMAEYENFEFALSFLKASGDLQIHNYITEITFGLHSFFYKNNFIRTRASYLTKS